jgi:hypothetical protein
LIFTILRRDIFRHCFLSFSPPAIFDAFFFIESSDFQTFSPGIAAHASVTLIRAAFDSACFLYAIDAPPRRHDRLPPLAGADATPLPADDAAAITLRRLRLFISPSLIRRFATFR